MKEEVEFFEYAMNRLSGKQSQVLKDMVLGQMSWQELMGKYNVSHAMIGKYRKKQSRNWKGFMV